jgi:glycosyltransferase involved in cell wall biosynthesis
MVAHARIFEDAAYLAKQRPSTRRLAGIIAISRAIEAELKQRSELAAIPVHRVYDAYAWHASSDEAPPFRQGRIACVGRLAPVKGQDILVRALKLMTTPRSYDLECVFAGSGEAAFTSQLASLAEGVERPRIRWLGVVDDVPSLLQSCSVLVCPSHREPLGRVIFEAWDAGVLPVVYAGSGGAAEVVTACDGGVLYAEQTPAALADAIDSVLSLPVAEARRMVANGRRWMEENVEPARSGAAVTDILLQATTGAGGPP